VLLGLMCACTADGCSSVSRQEPATSVLGQGVRHECRGRALQCDGRPPARLVSGAGQTEVKPRGTGVGALSPRVYPFLTFPGRPLPHDALVTKIMACIDPNNTQVKKKEEEDMELNPFGRSSKVQRSPVRRGEEKDGRPMGTVKTTPPPAPFKKPEEFPPLGTSQESVASADDMVERGMEGTPSVHALEMQVLRQQQDDASEEEASTINKMAVLLKEMAKSLAVQKNVKKAIKDGVPKLEDFLGTMNDCRKIRLQAVRREREISSKMISATTQAKVHLAESQLQSRKRAKRRRGSSSGSPELGEPRGLDTAQRPVLISAASQTDRVSAGTSYPGANHAPVAAPVTVPGPSLAPVLAPVTDMAEVPASSPSESWQTRLSKKERRKLKRVEAASKEMQKSRSAQVSKPVGEASGKPASKRARPRPKKPRAEAILIKPLGGRSFADVLGQIRTKAKPEETDTIIRSIRRTQNGDVLLELGKSKDRDGFAASLKTALGDGGAIRALEPRCSIEVRDLDALSTEDEVAGAVKAALPDSKIATEGLKVWLTKPNQRQQRMAVVELSEKHANKLLSLQHLRVGWVSCRLKRRVVVQRCFRCLGYGHSSRNCGGPDRSANCLRCGGQDHKRKDCTSTLSCFLCKETGSSGGVHGHMPGSGQCGVFRAALEQAKGKGQ